MSFISIERTQDVVLTPAQGSHADVLPHPNFLAMGTSMLSGPQWRWDLNVWDLNVSVPLNGIKILVNYFHSSIQVSGLSRKSQDLFLRMYSTVV